MKKTLIYLVPADNMNGDISSQTIIKEAKKTGKVLTVEQFIEGFNNQQINSAVYIIAQKDVDVRIQVLSPDGFTLERDEYSYASMKKAEEALEKFIKRLESQGYYSTIRNQQRVRIPLNEVKSYCKFIEIYE